MMRDLAQPSMAPLVSASESSYSPGGGTQPGSPAGNVVPSLASVVAGLLAGLGLGGLGGLLGLKR